MRLGCLTLDAEPYQLGDGRVLHGPIKVFFDPFPIQTNKYFGITGGQWHFSTVHFASQNRIQLDHVFLQTTMSNRHGEAVKVVNRNLIRHVPKREHVSNCAISKCWIVLCNETQNKAQNRNPLEKNNQTIFLIYSCMHFAALLNSRSLNSRYLKYFLFCVEKYYFSTQKISVQKQKMSIALSETLDALNDTRNLPKLRLKHNKKYAIKGG